MLTEALQTGFCVFAYAFTEVTCAECECLLLRRDTLRRAYEGALAKLSVARSSTSADAYMKLRRATQEARIELNLAETELMQHQDQHALAN